MFDLNQQIQAWRAALSQAPSVRARDVEEMAGHLCDIVSKLREAGLTDEEAFWVASRRLGPIEELATEFGKINGELVGWRRVWWMLLGYFVFSLSLSWSSFASAIPQILAIDLQIPFEKVLCFYYAGLLLLELATIACVVYLIGADKGTKILQLLLRPRLKVFFIATLLILLMAAPPILRALLKASLTAGKTYPVTSTPIWENIVIYCLWLEPILFNIGIVALLIWLPRRNRRQAVIPE